MCDFWTASIHRRFAFGLMDLPARVRPLWTAPEVWQGRSASPVAPEGEAPLQGASSSLLLFLGRCPQATMRVRLRRVANPSSGAFCEGVGEGRRQLSVVGVLICIAARYEARMAPPTFPSAQSPPGRSNSRVARAGTATRTRRSEDDPMPSEPPARAEGQGRGRRARACRVRG